MCCSDLQLMSLVEILVSLSLLSSRPTSRISRQTDTHSCTDTTYIKSCGRHTHTHTHTHTHEHAATARSFAFRVPRREHEDPLPHTRTRPKKTYRRLHFAVSCPKGRFKSTPHFCTDALTTTPGESSMMGWLSLEGGRLKNENE